MEKPSLLLVGNGKMGSSFIHQIKHLFQTTVVSPNSKPNYECKYFSCLSKIDTLFDVIIFAVKPYQIEMVIKKLNTKAYNSNTKIISLIAGAKTDFFKQNLKSKCQIYLCMPNLPVKSGKGIVAVFGPEKLDFLNPLGQIIYCRTEDEIDKYTSVIGSGSGFVFHLLSAYEESAKQLDLGEDVDTRRLVLNLFKGTLEMAEKRMQSDKGRLYF
jgi:pyrroline-5-carboxylate reductase